VGLDSQWVASLRGSSWASFALSPGQHRVCIQKYDVAPFSLYLDSLSTMGGQNTYFESFFEDDGDLGASYSSTQLDPDEGAMLVALYPQASPPHP
jgi:hypothetical protein